MIKQLARAIMVTSFCALPLAAMAGDKLAGEYICSGYDPVVEQPYHNAHMSIEAKDNVYHFFWRFEDGSTYRGRGTMNTSQEFLGAVFWQVSDKEGQQVDKSDYGMQMYDVDKDYEELHGQWFFIEDNDTEVGYEKCVRKDEDDNDTS